MDAANNAASATAALLAALGTGGREKPKHYVTAGSEAGRRLTQAKGAVIAKGPLSAHNQAIEDARREKLAARKARQEAKA